MQVVPTNDEIMCRLAPFLPLVCGSSHVHDGVERRLDVVFRQYREDMLRPIREAMQVGAFLSFLMI
jgi:hypothetical protein